jgi:hypothetical protein
MAVARQAAGVISSSRRFVQGRIQPSLHGPSTVEAHRASTIDEKEPNPVIPDPLDPEEERL